MSKATRTLIGPKARKAVLDGVNAIAVPVAKTFGPQGKNALLYRTYNRGSRITNDGFTVAECQEPQDLFVRMAAQAFKESCKRTNEKVGDGTTGTAIIGGRLMNDVYSLLTDGASSFTASNSGKMGVMTIKNKIRESAEKVKESIKALAKKVESLEELEKIAIVSVEDIELGKTIAQMAWEVGIDGFIDVIEGYKGEIETEVIKGMRFAAKVSAKAFVNNPNRYEMIATDCPILVTNYAMDNGPEVAQLFLKLNASTSKIIVIAPSYSNDVLVNMVNATKQGYFFFPVLTPSLRTEQLEDLAIYCGAIFIDKNKGKTLRNVKFEDLGFLEKLIVKDTELREDAVATGGAGTREATIMDGYKEEEVEVQKKGKTVIEKRKVANYVTSTELTERIKILKQQLEETPQEQFKKLLERRIASMGSSVGVIRVGDSTQASSLYRKLKIEDAVYACKAALRGGYVKGGGVCLKSIADMMEDDDILKNAILAPYEQIQASVDGGMEISEDIIDPAEAIYYAVEHACSVVENLGTVEIITAEVEDLMQGEGELSIARALNELAINDKIHKGQLQENEREMERDRMNGLTVDEKISLDNG